MMQDPLFLISANMFAAVVLRAVKSNLLSALVLAIVMIASGAYLGANHASAILVAIYDARDFVLTQIGKPATWPPETHRAFPDLVLRDQDGNLTKLSEFKGHVILIEPVGMSCPGCIAFSGGHHRGAFLGIEPQQGLGSIEEYAQQYGGIDLNQPGLVVIQILLFNHDMQAPRQEEVAHWANHFGFQRSNNRIVLGGTPQLANEASQALIPGFQLIDKKFVLRMNSTGNQPADDLYNKLLPAINELLAE